MSNQITLQIEGIDPDLLERQRIALMRFLVVNGKGTNKADIDLLDGLLNMLDAWSDKRMRDADNPSVTSNTAGHSPAPWTMRQMQDKTIEIKAASKMCKLNNVIAYMPGDDEDDTANARLIAAAPDLLDAARDSFTAIESAYESLHELLKGTGEYEDDEDIQNVDEMLELGCRLVPLTEAINKATGDQAL